MMGKIGGRRPGYIMSNAAIYWSIVAGLLLLASFAGAYIGMEIL
jgi:hypothetical protein